MAQYVFKTVNANVKVQVWLVYNSMKDNLIAFASLKIFLRHFYY